MSRVGTDLVAAVERSTEPIVAWRSWALTGRRDGTRLLLRPVAGRAHPWRPRELATATCKRSGVFHEAPAVSCTCGLHASQTLDILRRTKCPAVLGRVALWGRVVEHELGYRARFAYPQRLRLICQFCFWQKGPLGRAPAVVAFYPRDELVPLCASHLESAHANGMPPRRLLPADLVDQRLRDIYAVDPLAI
ncbi:MAG: hypothetical protein ACXWZU_04970 [Actinomycetota bacterium]